jgi:hypothetical protein
VKRPVLLLVIIFLARALASNAATLHPSLPAIGSIDGLGVNIHFTDPKPGELEMIKAAGFKWIRMDFAWGATERKSGEYDFSAYDRLVAALEKNGLRAVLILDYGNPLYDSGLAPHTDEGRTAFAKWAAAAVKRYAGKGYLWEMWNEPNIAQFWKPKPDVQQYVALAKRVAAELRAARLLPMEAFIGPATSTIDLKFLEACFKAGLLEEWAGVSVHPYRQKPPETVEDEYRSVRLLIDRYAPKDKSIPVLSGEWGYSAAWPSIGKDEATREESQAKYLARMFLTNIANDVPLSIWYDWRDDGDDPKEGEHRFGIVRRPYREGEKEVFEPKPTYHAMQTLTAQLAGMQFARAMHDEHSSRLLFANDQQVKPVIWKDGSHGFGTEVRLPSGMNCLSVSMTGGITRKGFTGTLQADSDEPSYLTLDDSHAAQLLRVAATIPRLPLEEIVEAPTKISTPVSARNVLNQAVTGSVSIRRSIQIDNKLELEVSGRQFMAGLRLDPGGTVQSEISNEIPRRQDGYLLREMIALNAGNKSEGLNVISSVPIVVTNALRVDWTALDQRHILVRLLNPTGREFRGDARFVDVKGINGTRSEVTTPVPLVFESGQTDQQLTFPLTKPVKSWPRHALEWRDANRETAGLAFPPALSVFPEWLEKSMSTVLDGDAKVTASVETLGSDKVPDPAPVEGESVGYKYHFEAGWRFFRVPLQVEIPELSQPSDNGVQFALWIHGDAKGCLARIRFKDASGQTFQSDGPKIDFTGWRVAKFSMQSSAEHPLPHWGGANDGVIHYPITWDSILLLDNVSKEAVEGEIHISAPTLIY